MNLILITTRPNGSLIRRSANASHHFALLGFAFASVLAAAGGAGYWLGHAQGAKQPAQQSWQTRLAEQQQELARVRRDARAEVSALTARLARLQSRLTRLNALGQRLVERTSLEASEFDFDREPGIGGVAPGEDATGLAASEFEQELALLERRVDDRREQLEVIDRVLGDRELEAASKPAGKPVSSGWMSSSYGYRKDPFTGKQAWHDGVDFAGREASPIEAVGAGVVSFAGERWGYGRLVEITHGNGYVTRYGHNAEITVDEGDLVHRGDQVAKMGSSGRSTGPHVHLEVLKDGESVNPWQFVQAER